MRTYFPPFFRLNKLALPGLLIALSLLAFKDSRAQDSGRQPGRVKALAAQAAPARELGGGRRSLGGVKDIALDEHSASVKIALAPEEANRLRQVLQQARDAGAGTSGSPGPAGAGYKSAKIVLDRVRIEGAGAQGGYFYDLYLNLPQGATGPALQRHLLGNVGPFQVSAASRNGATAVLGFPATRLLLDLDASRDSGLILSFVRVSGQTSPSGRVLSIGEVRLELSSDPIE